MSVPSKLVITIIAAKMLAYTNLTIDIVLPLNNIQIFTNLDRLNIIGKYCVDCLKCVALAGMKMYDIPSNFCYRCIFT